MEIKMHWSDAALARLEDIFDFHKTKASRTTAKKLFKSFIQKALILQKTPLHGVKEPLLSNRTLTLV